jgi:hypothetical protein
MRGLQPHHRSLLALALLVAAAAGTRAGDTPDFEKQVAPLLRSRCLNCHAGPRAKGDLDLTTARGLLAGGSHGEVVVPGKAADSPMYTRVRDHKMPPREPLSDAEAEILRRWVDAGAAWKGEALSATVKSDSARAGSDWWSLRPIRRPNVPAVKATERVRNPIDAFVLGRLEAEGLSPAAEADRRTYARRVTLDLTGLLPTPEEVDAFVADKSPDAYEKLVDRLLASPAYGERWARHWLDVARFAESHGYEMNTLRPNAWPYRDYVICAFNEDRPFPRFVREQLAGDAVAAGDKSTEGSTGFLVGGPHDMVGNGTPEGRLQQRSDDLFDMVSTTSTAFLGLTVGCARCHDHKFDPITQRDFYAMESVFAGVDHAERPSLAGADEHNREREELRSEVARLEQEIDEHAPVADPGASRPAREGVRPTRNVERFSPVAARFVRVVIAATVDGTEPCIDELEVYGPDVKRKNLALASAGAKVSASSVYPDNPNHKLEHLNDGRYGNGRSWISAEPGKGLVQVQLAETARVDRVVWGRDRERKFADRVARDYLVQVSLDGSVWQTVAGSADRLPPGTPARQPGKDLAALTARKTKLEERLKVLENPPMVYAGAFHTPGPTHRLSRGDPTKPLEVVEPAAVAAVRPAVKLRPGAGEPDRRLALADWLASPENPLPARVMVNRVWHWHFGQGIVRTPSDFGFNGDRPSHPELLDWLAAEYQTNGWHLKPLHRLIVLSSTYRQASRIDAMAAARDAGNRLLWRFTPRRLEAEEVRDTMLQVSGALDRKMGGPGYNLWEYSGYVIVFAPRAELGPDTFRRMIYQFKPRLQQDSTFGAFDCPDATQPAPRRNVSTTALQALNLLNDPFVHGQAARFADRVRGGAGPEAVAEVALAFRLAFQREPTAPEAQAAAKLVREHGLPVLCRALFNANEFVLAD